MPNMVLQSQLAIPQESADFALARRKWRHSESISRLFTLTLAESQHVMDSVDGVVSGAKWIVLSDYNKWEGMEEGIGDSLYVHSMTRRERKRVIYLGGNRPHSLWGIVLPSGGRALQHAWDSSLWEQNAAGMAAARVDSDQEAFDLAIKCLLHQERIDRLLLDGVAPLYVHPAADGAGVDIYWPHRNRSLTDALVSIFYTKRTPHEQPGRE